MRLFFLFVLLLSGVAATGHTHRLEGILTDTTGTPLSGASVALLYPEDSTLAFFSISDGNGAFGISEVKDGHYILQVALVGYYTEYRSLVVSSAGHDKLGLIVLKANGMGTMLDEVIISGEKIPLQVRGDTLEYNAGSFKVKPDAVVEDLLRKLPGVQVDQEGNIKSMGKEVTKVLVDGKEFFGDDPKVATRNLPADAVEKVQAFEKKSDHALFTGIDDGQREQTLNLKLKDGHKAGYFGEARGGLGLPKQYDASLKAFKFREKSQLSALGMINNVNKFGFTFEDYINFNGGLSSLMRSGGNMNLDADDIPVDFGQQVTGEVSSGALGLNYSTGFGLGNRWTFSYMGNGVQKLLNQVSSSQNLVGNGGFSKKDQTTNDQRLLNNRLSTSLRTKVDSVHLLMLSGYARLGNNKNEESLQSASYSRDILQNSLSNQTEIMGNSFEAGANMRWTRKMKGKWPAVETRLEGAYSQKAEKSKWNNHVQYPIEETEFTDAQYQDNEQRKINALASVAPLRKLGKAFFLEPSLSTGFDIDHRSRIQGLLPKNQDKIDSLSPKYQRNVISLSPSLQLRRLLKNTRWHIGIEQTCLWINTIFNNTAKELYMHNYWLPSASGQHDIAAGTRLSIQYNTRVTAPTAAQLLPVTDYSNPLMRMTGNQYLLPEYTHTLDINYNRFDQFSMSSFYIMMGGSYTADKIDWSRTVFPDLSQQLQTINTPYALQTHINTKYARPVNMLGLQASIGLNETWTSTISPVNSVNNKNNTWVHELEAGINNLNSSKWDLRLNGTIRITDAQYSINNELDNTYYNYTLNGKVGYYPTQRWYISASCDLTHYTARSFGNPVTIPLVRAELSRYLFPNNRGTLTISGFDLLDRNSAVQRMSQVNYQLEQRSNTIGRYVMLSFAYKLSRTGNPGGAIQINSR